MIRKPDAHEFRERAAVTAIRDARSLAVEGARGVREGTQSFVRRAVGSLFLMGFCLSMIAHLGPLTLLVALGGGLTWFLSRQGERRRRTAHGRTAASLATGSAMPVEPVRYELRAGVAARRAARIGVPAILFFPTSALLYMGPLALAAVTSLALAFLTLARLFGDRTLLAFDSESVTAKGLLGEGTMLWADVEDVGMHAAPWHDFKLLLVSGGRRNIVLHARVNRLGGPDTLYVPVDLLGLDEPALIQLVSRLIQIQAGTSGAPATAPPRPAAPASSPAPAIHAETGFDPDAIMARYMAEREALVAARRSDRDAAAMPPRPTFGRKRVA